MKISIKNIFNSKYFCHPELVSGSTSQRMIYFVEGWMLKQVQHDNSVLQKAAIAAMCLFTVAACTLGPDYQLPSSSLPEKWLSTTYDPQAEIEQNWWKHFHDPILDQLISKAIAGNWDLKIAEARIAQARAERTIANNDLLPTINTVGAFERQANRLAIGNAPIDLTKPFNTFQAGFDASWELDLFGGKQREIESATAQLKAAEASRDDARISLLAEVARTYIDIRHYQAQVAIAQDALATQEQSLKIAKERFQAGSTAGFDVSQAEAQAKQTKAQFPYYQNLVAQAQLSMDVLLGEKPGVTQSLITSSHPIPLGDKTWVASAPAKVIASRPDIRVAERKLAAATAQQGVAVAQFFPDVSLTGFLGLLNTDAGNLLRTTSKSWDVGGNILWPILNYGKLEANLHAADAREQEALAIYQKSIIAALSDVERSVTAYTKEEEHRALLEEAKNANLHTVKIARERYKEGLSSFIEVLDAERTLYAAQSQAATATAATSQNLIAVYKSLGGGWKDTEIKTGKP